MMKWKKKKQTVKLNNGEKAIVNRDDITVSYRGKTIDIEAIVNLMIDVEQGALYTIRRDEDKKIIIRKI